VIAIHPLLGLVRESGGDPHRLEHVVQLRQRRGNRDGTVMEQVQGAVEGVAERERGRG
jgi:hypothetical protein